MRGKEKSLDAYFSTLTPLPAEDLSSISTALLQAQQHSLSRISAPRSARTRSSIVRRSYESSVTSAKHKLVEAKKLRSEVEGRLAFVGGMIDEIKGRRQRRICSSRTKSVTDGSFRRPASEEPLSEEGLELLKRLQHEKEIRHQKLQRVREARESQLLQQFASEQEKEEHAQRLQREARIEELRRRHGIVQQRKVERRRNQSACERRLHEIKNQKPLYESLEEQFTERVVKAELLRQRAVLSRKKDSIDLQSVLRHSAEVQKNELDQERKRRERRIKRERDLKQFQMECHFFRPKIASVVETEAAEQHRSQLDQAEVPKRLSVRRQRYASLVRELFKPKISKLKQLEAQMNRELADKKPLTDRVREKPPAVVEKVSPVRYRKKSKSTHSLPEPAVLKPKNYLNDLKAERQQSALADQRYDSKLHLLLSEYSNPDRIPRVQKEIHRLESWARDQEQVLNTEGMDWEQSVQQREVVSALYIDSIKAKLALLEEIGGNT